MNRENVTILTVIHQRVKEINNDNQNPSICVEQHMLLVNGVQNSQFLHKKKERKKEQCFTKPKLHGMRTTPVLAPNYNLIPKTKQKS